MTGRTSVWGGSEENIWGWWVMGVGVGIRDPCVPHVTVCPPSTHGQSPSPGPSTVAVPSPCVLCTLTGKNPSHLERALWCPKGPSVASHTGTGAVRGSPARALTSLSHTRNLEPAGHLSSSVDTVCERLRSRAPRCPPASAHTPNNNWNGARGAAPRPAGGCGDPVPVPGLGDTDSGKWVLPVQAEHQGTP